MPIKEKNDIGKILNEDIKVDQKRRRLTMIINKSAREVLRESEIQNKLRECFKKCAFGRAQLRKCIVNAMNAGLTKDDVLSITDGKDNRFEPYPEASLCTIIAIGQVLRYEKKRKQTRTKAKSLTDKKKEEIKKTLEDSFKKCVLAKYQLRKCVSNAMDIGLSKEEVLAITDDIVGGLGENQISLCAIVAIDHALSYEENIRAKPIDIVKERKLERDDV